MDELREKLGWGLVISGVLLIFGLKYLAPLAEDATHYEVVEQHITGGMVLGIGLVVIHFRPWRPVLVSVASIIGWASFGFLVGRFVGLAFVAGDAPYQWAWVALEVVLVFLSALYIRRRT